MHRSLLLACKQPFGEVMRFSARAALALRIVCSVAPRGRCCQSGFRVQTSQPRVHCAVARCHLFQNGNWSGERVEPESAFASTNMLYRPWLVRPLADHVGRIKRASYTRHLTTNVVSGRSACAFPSALGGDILHTGSHLRVSFARTPRFGGSRLQFSAVKWLRRELGRIAMRFATRQRAAILAPVCVLLVSTSDIHRRALTCGEYGVETWRHALQVLFSVPSFIASNVRPRRCQVGRVRCIFS